MVLGPETNMDVAITSSQTQRGLLQESASRILKDVEANSKFLAAAIASTSANIQSHELSTSKGISFIEMKNMTMLNYLIDLSYIALRKCNGQSIEDNQAIKRIVEARTVLEKMKPINYKLKYRIDKLIRAANTGGLSADDPLSMRARPEDLVADEDDQESDQSEVEESNKTVELKEKKSGIYQPPKISAMHYDEDEDDSKKRKAIDSAKRRAFSSSVIKELRNEFDEAPEEIAESSVGRRKSNRQEKEREKYEEEYMMRLNTSKKLRNRDEKHNMLTMSALARDMTRFEDVSALDRDMPEEGPSHKRRKSSGKGKKKSVSKKNNKFRRRK